VEGLGWDEAFVAAPSEPLVVARDLQRRVLEATSLHCTVGIGQNKLQAKMATQFGKPAGVFQLRPEDWLPLFGERPTSAIWGIGPRIARRLAELDIHTVADLAAVPPAELVPHFGPSTGPWIASLGRGAWDSPVSDAPRVAVSRSREETFQVDLTSWPAVVAALDALARSLMATVVADGRSVMRVFVKVRFVPFSTKIKGRKLPAPTTSADVVAACALELLDTFPTDRAVRLLGVRTEFTPPLTVQDPTHR
jgi:DNA polymerase IV